MSLPVATKDLLHLYVTMPPKYHSERSSSQQDRKNREDYENYRFESHLAVLVVVCLVVASIYLCGRDTRW